MDFRDLATTLSDLKKQRKTSEKFKLEGLHICVACDNPHGGAPWCVKTGDMPKCRQSMHAYAHKVTCYLDPGTNCKLLAKDLKEQLIVLYNQSKKGP